MTHMLKQRISEHKSSIRRYEVNYPVTSLQLQGIEHNELQREGGIWKERYIFRIEPLDISQPIGLNEDFDMSVMVIFLYSYAVIQLFNVVFGIYVIKRLLPDTPA